MDATAVIFREPKKLELRTLAIAPPAPTDVVVDVEWSAISTGTERLLFQGAMPPFPGLAYPLVPGYESVGRVAHAGTESGLAVGDRVFVPGASCFGDVRGLFGGAASKLTVAGARVTKIDEALAERGVLVALAATAYHAIAPDALPELIVGHGVLGRLLARIAVARGGSPVVWETNPVRREGDFAYAVVDPARDARKDYRAIYDVSGDASLVEPLLGRLAKRGELVLAGFYERIAFAFPLAFMREAKIRVAAEFLPEDQRAVLTLVAAGRLSLDGLITHAEPFENAERAYVTAFEDPACLKMLIDWRKCS